MKKLISFSLIFLFVSTASVFPTLAQESDANDTFRKQFNRHFQYASRVLALAKAMPADTYSWRPQEGVMSVEEVYTHIARYNYLYLQNQLDIAAPEGVNIDEVESITGKEAVVDILERSIQHVNHSIEQMPDAKFSQPTELYGNTVNGQAVLMQLITHKSEHVGQSIAYARMNEVVPPWSQ